VDGQNGRLVLQTTDQRLIPFGPAVIIDTIATTPNYIPLDQQATSFALQMRFSSGFTNYIQYDPGAPKSDYPLANQGLKSLLQTFYLVFHLF